MNIRLRGVIYGLCSGIGIKFGFGIIKSQKEKSKMALETAILQRFYAFWIQGLW